MVKRLVLGLVAVSGLAISVMAQSAPPESLSYESFFPFKGIQFGRTGPAELKALGHVPESSGEDGLRVSVEGLEFWIRKDATVYVQVRKPTQLPDAWAFMRPFFSMSHAEVLAYLEARALNHIEWQAPKLSLADKGEDEHAFINTYGSTLLSAIHVDLPGPLPVRLDFTFIDSVTELRSDKSPKGLYSFSLSAKDRENPLLEPAAYRNQEPLSLDPARRSALGLCGILMEVNGSAHETLGVSLSGTKDAEAWRHILKRDWGVETRAQLLETIASLERAGHSASYDELKVVHDGAAAGSLLQAAKVVALEPYEVSRLFVVASIANAVGERSLRAWDLGRVIALARWGYEVGDLEEAEAWSIILRTAGTIYGLYSSWEDFGANYLLGRIFWSSAGEDFVDSMNRAIAAYCSLLNRRGSVWHDVAFPTSRPSGGPVATMFDVAYHQSKEARAWDHARAGSAAFSAGQYKSAGKRFAKAIEFFPAFSDAYLQLAAALKAQGDYVGSERTLRTFIARWPYDIDGAVALGALFEARGKMEEALKSFVDAIGLDDADYRSYFGIGRIKLRLGAYAEAAGALEAALERAQGDSDAETGDLVYALGIAQLQLERCDEAVANFTKVYERYRTVPAYNYLFGLAHLLKSAPDLGAARHFIGIAESLGYAVPAEVKRRLQEGASPETPGSGGT